MKKLILIAVLLLALALTAAACTADEPAETTAAETTASAPAATTAEPVATTEEPEETTAASASGVVVVDPRTLEAGSITGHCAEIVPASGHDNSAMIAAAGLESGAMLHQGSIYLGEYDLTKCEKVVIYYATDWGDGTQSALAAARDQGFGYLGLSAIDCNNVVNPDRAYFIGELYTPDGMWQVTAHELPNVALSGYSGPVYLSADFLEGQFIVIDRVEIYYAD